MSFTNHSAPTHTFVLSRPIASLTHSLIHKFLYMILLVSQPRLGTPLVFVRDEGTGPGIAERTRSPKKGTYLAAVAGNGGDARLAKGPQKNPRPGQRSAQPVREVLRHGRKIASCPLGLVEQSNVDK